MALAVLFALGCSAPMRGYGSSAASGYGYVAEGELVATSNDTLGTLNTLDMVQASPAPADYKAKKQSRKADRYDAPAAPPSPNGGDGSSLAKDAEVGEAPKPPADQESQSSSPTRQIIYTAGMGLSVFDVADVMAKLEAIPERHGGWLHQRYDNSLILRVPAAKLDLIIREISTWGVVDWKTLAALDVTAEYTDIDSRIRVLEQVQVHLQELLARAESVEQALELQVELGKITAELEQLRAQMRMLSSAIEFSTLAVELRARGSVEPEPGDDPFPWVDELGAESTAYGSPPPTP